MNQIFNIAMLRAMRSIELMNYADSVGVENVASLDRNEIIAAIIHKLSVSHDIFYAGVLEIVGDGFGFLRDVGSGYVASPSDVYVAPGMIKKCGLRTGDLVYGQLRLPKDNEKYLALNKIFAINQINIEDMKYRPVFDDLIPIHPTEQIVLERIDIPTEDMTVRIIDLLIPIGKGQRLLLVAPPRVGKTVILENMATSIMKNYPEVHLMALLIDERPEEVTEMRRLITKGEVISSTFDEPPQRHLQAAEITIERAKRLVEMGHEVVILLDSITRLARANNILCPSSGKVLTGGVDAHALQKPKRFFGAARNLQEGGSLTIIATALVDTGSKMDDVIFEEFKGTGNAEIILKRELADKGIFPAIDVMRSGTRKEELLKRGTEKESLERSNKKWILKRVLDQMSSSTIAMEFLIDKMRRTKNNTFFLNTMNQ